LPLISLKIQTRSRDPQELGNHCPEEQKSAVKTRENSATQAIGHSESDQAMRDESRWMNFRDARWTDVRSPRPHAAILGPKSIQAGADEEPVLSGISASTSLARRRAILPAEVDISAADHVGHAFLTRCSIPSRTTFFQVMTLVFPQPIRVANLSV